MPSIIIGGENTNVGLRYLDELARQRELALREAAFARSASSGDSGASGANNFGSGYTSTQKAYKAPQNAQEAPIAPNGAGATGGGLSDDYNQRILQMRKLYANQQNEDNQRRVQELQSEVGSHDNSLKTMTAMLSQAQEKDQVDSLIGSMRGLMTKKAAAMNEMRERQYRHPQTGDASTDQALSFMPHAQPAQVEPDTSQYQAMGTFAAQGVQAKNAEKQRVRDEASKEKEKYQGIINAQKRVADIQKKIDTMLQTAKGGSPDSVAELKSAELAQEYEDASKALDALLGNKDHVDQYKAQKSVIDSAKREAVDKWNATEQKKAADAEKEKRLKMKDEAELMNAATANLAKEAATMSAEKVESFVNAAAEEFKRATGMEIPDDVKHGLMTMNPSYETVESTLRPVRSMAPEQALQYLTEWLNDMSQPEVTEKRNTDGQSSFAIGGVTKLQSASVKGKFDPQYVENKIRGAIQMYTQRMQQAQESAQHAAMGVYVQPGYSPMEYEGGKPRGYDPMQREKANMPQAKPFSARGTIVKKTSFGDVRNAYDKVK